MRKSIFQKSIFQTRTFATQKKLTFFTKPNCSLCVPAKEIIDQVRTKVEFDLEVVDITQNKNQEWFNLYKYDIPVLHLEGVEISRHHFNEKEILTRLQYFPHENPQHLLSIFWST